MEQRLPVPLLEHLQGEPRSATGGSLAKLYRTSNSPFGLSAPGPILHVFNVDDCIDRAYTHKAANVMDRRGLTMKRKAYVKPTFERQTALQVITARLSYGCPPGYFDDGYGVCIPDGAE